MLVLTYDRGSTGLLPGNRELAPLGGFRSRKAFLLVETAPLLCRSTEFGISLLQPQSTTRISSKSRFRNHFWLAAAINGT